ncbi:hypothetical protein AVEN_186276-1, partial [Araneus ventricosus]
GSSAAQRGHDEAGPGPSLPEDDLALLQQPSRHRLRRRDGKRAVVMYGNQLRIRHRVIYRAIPNSWYKL